MNTMEFKGFDGHLILWCKDHYSMNNEIDLFLQITRIWEVRCGLPVDSLKGQYVNIVDHMYKILQKTDPIINVLHEIVHREICNEFMYHNKTPIERLLLIYKNRISQLQVYDTKTNKVLIKLPRIKKGIFKSIIEGRGKFNHYELIEKII